MVWKKEVPYDFYLRVLVPNHVILLQAAILEDRNNIRNIIFFL